MNVSTPQPARVTEGLMAFRADIAIERQAAFQRWHNNEHIPERLSIPGFVRGRRYRSVASDTRFLMYYDTTSLRALTSAAYLAALNAPTQRTRTALRWFENPMRTAYTLVDAVGRPEFEAAPIIVVAAYAPPAPQGRLAAPDALRALAALAGVQRVHDYRLDNAGSTISTGEASVHGAAPNPVSGLVIVYSDDLALLDQEPAWNELSAAMNRWAASNGIVGGLHIDIYSREFALESSETTE